MIRLLFGLMVLGVVANIVGCGGVSETDMRKYAIRRPKDDEDDDTKPNVPSAPTPNRPAPNAGATPNGNSPVATAPSPTSPNPTSPNTPTAAPGAPAPNAGNASSVDSSVSDTRQPDPSLSITQRRQMTIDNMRRITRAIEAYREANGTYPPRAICTKGGHPLLSWRVLLLPTLGYQSLYDQFKLDEPWDSLHNQPLVKLIPSVFQSPDRFDTSTNYLVPVAGTAAFSGTKGKHPRRWEDGIRNIAILLEVDDTHSVPWSAPNDLELNLRQPTMGLGGLRADGFFVGWGGGQVGRVAADVSPRDAKAMFTVDGGETFSSASISRAANATPLVTGPRPGVNRPPVTVAANQPSNAGPVGVAPPPPAAVSNPGFTYVPPGGGASGADSLLSKAIIARDAELNNDAYRLILAAYVTGEPVQVAYQWFPTLRRPALAVRFGAGVSYAGTQSDSVRNQFRTNSNTEGRRDARSQLNSVVGDLTDPVFDQLTQFKPIVPPMLSQPSPRQRRNNRRLALNMGPHVEVIGEGDRNTLIRAAMQAQVDVLLYFDVSERATRTNKKSKSVKFSVIDVWRGRDLLAPQEVNYLRREMADTNALYEDPIDKIAENFRRFLTDKLRGEPIPPALRETHAKKRVVSLARRRVPDPLSVLAEVKFYRDAGLLSVQDQMTAYQQILRNEAAGTELLAGGPNERQTAIREWIPVISPETVLRAQRGYGGDDDDD